MGMTCKESIQRLKNSGVDVEEVMPVFLSDEEYYLGTMRSFLAENEITALQESMRQKDYTEATTHAHNIKALTGTLGIVKAFTAAEVMCLQLKQMQYDEAEIQMRKIAESYEAIKQILG